MFLFSQNDISENIKKYIKVRNSSFNVNVISPFILSTFSRYVLFIVETTNTRFIGERLTLVRIYSNNFKG